MRLCPVRPVAWISHGEVIEALVATRLTASAPMLGVQELSRPPRAGSPQASCGPRPARSAPRAGPASPATARPPASAVMPGATAGAPGPISSEPSAPTRTARGRARARRPGTPPGWGDVPPRRPERAGQALLEHLSPGAGLGRRGHGIIPLDLPGQAESAAASCQEDGRLACFSRRQLSGLLQVSSRSRARTRAGAGAAGVRRARRSACSPARSRSGRR